MKKVFALTLITLSFGCAHYHKVVPNHDDPTLVKVKIGSKEVREGDTLNVYKSTCKNAKTTRGNAPQVCDHQILGRAKVVQVLGERESLVEPKDGLAIDDTMHLENGNHPN